MDDVTAPSQAGQLERADGPRLAFVRSAGLAPEIVFLGGWASTMSGTKSLFLEAHARRLGHAFTRFDYRGHGASDGRFEDATIGDWLDDTLAVLDAVVRHPFVLVGSSMGAWLMLLAALARPDRLRGLVGIAAAPDFTTRLLEPALTAAQRESLEREGLVALPSAYGDPVPLRPRFLEEGARHALLGAPIAIGRPVHLLHGQDDADVPWQLSLELAARLKAPHVTLELVKDGDHRLSRPSDLRRIMHALDHVLEDAL
ncbi:MAG: alpha/beta hydrolase [Geminicoccaceae bacterium]|nr:alpha/beta hydrolase [Geminicoccaceae bacterium]